MKLHEAEARELLRRAGLPVPDGEVATTPAAARAAAERLFAAGAAQVVIKAQVLVGGRGKAGGVKLAANADEAEKTAAQILALTIKDLPRAPRAGSTRGRHRARDLPFGPHRPKQPRDPAHGVRRRRDGDRRGRRKGSGGHHPRDRTSTCRASPLSGATSRSPHRRTRRTAQAVRGDRNRTRARGPRIRCRSC